ncbi:MAG TPA: hypothetical protein VFW11_07025 [Cyclobacteriaceae bacterium]|nr:hypothetical protein [Cyclobacteriaceae bacterium]
MKSILYALTVFCLVFSYKAFPQGTCSKHKNCATNCFKTEVVKSELKSDGCINYVLRVSYNGDCAHALSHYTVAVTCGKISNASNSENWKIEYGKDPTTGLYGFKVDDIPNFGETALKCFLVSFTVCPEGTAKCATKESCCYPIIAYKAGTHVYYDKLPNACPSPEPTPELKASLTKNDISCNGANDGSLSVVVEGGKEPFSYAWSTNETSSSISGLAPGEYNVIVKDADGLELSLTGNISEPPAIVIAGSVTNESCGGENGSINLDVSGGSGSYTYTWTNAATTEDIGSLGAGSYSVTVKDEKGCTADTTFIVENQSSLSITAATTMTGCGKTNGALDITVSGGTAPYTYQWSNGATTEDLMNIGPGTYRVTVVDATGCTTEMAYAIKENNTLKLTYAVTQTTCLDDGSGAIDLMVQGGSQPYSYVWSNGSTTQDISGLTAGFYSVTVTDNAGCTSTIRISVTKKTFVVNEQVIQPACGGSQGGSITLNPVNGVAPYTYEWSNGSTGNSLSGLEPGIYTVKVTDATGCSRDLAYVITDPTGITSSATVTNDQCNSQGNFSIDITVTGGQGPYTYEWSNGETTEDLANLETGIYTVTITDVNGCSTVREVEVTGSPTWTCLIDQPSVEVLCSSTGNSLNTSISGADSYSWTVESSDGQWAIASGASTPSIEYTAGGINSTATFTLTIFKDGCTQTCEYVVTTCKENPTTPPDDTDGGDDGTDDGGSDDGTDGGGTDDGGDDDHSGTCESCFESDIVKISNNGNCYMYEVKVSTNGECRHDLSHWDIAIPCGTVSDYSNSENWKMVFGEDPTTGIYGLKVDDISNFGSTNDYFTVKFTICYDDYTCRDKLNSWDPVVAYKAGLCIAYDTLNRDDQQYNDDGDETPVCKTYPNPYRDKVCFEWKADRDEEACLEIFDSQGRYVRDLYKGRVYKGENYKVECTDLDGSLYIYRFRSGSKTYQGKICKAR